MDTLMNVPKNGGLKGTTSDRPSNAPTFSSWMDEFFNRDWPSFSQNFNTGITLPKVNIRETANEYFVEMAVPGMKKSDFNIELDNKILVISNEKNEEQETKEENYTRREFGYSSFKRSFSLPETVNEEDIKAEYQDGILSLHLPKREEAKQKPPRNIEIS